MYSDWLSEISYTRTYFYYVARIMQTETKVGVSTEMQMKKPIFMI